MTLEARMTKRASHTARTEGIETVVLIPRQAQQSRARATPPAPRALKHDKPMLRVVPATAREPHRPHRGH